MFVEMDIYFSDLNEDAQQRLLNLVGAKDAAEMNWDLDISPLFTYLAESNEEEEVF